MKKVFLLFGIAAFGSASAQQKDAFDFNGRFKELIYKKGDSVFVINPSAIIMNTNTGSAGQGYNFSYTLNNGDKVFVLNVDNMPCVVPDMNQFKVMPNIARPDENFMAQIGKQNLSGKIPNPAPPFMIIPKIK
jgi:hypothetical protein